MCYTLRKIEGGVGALQESDHTNFLKPNVQSSNLNIYDCLPPIPFFLLLVGPGKQNNSPRWSFLLSYIVLLKQRLCVSAPYILYCSPMLEENWESLVEYSRWRQRLGMQLHVIVSYINMYLQILSWSMWMIAHYCSYTCTSYTNVQVVLIDWLIEGVSCINFQASETSQYFWTELHVVVQRHALMQRLFLRRFYQLIVWIYLSTCLTNVMLCTGSFHMARLGISVSKGFFIFRLVASSLTNTGSVLDMWYVSGLYSCPSRRFNQPWKWFDIVFFLVVGNLLLDFEENGKSTSSV